MSTQPVWKQYAARKRVWSEADKIAYELAKENYQKVITAVIEDGLSWHQAAINFRLPENVVSRIARRWGHRLKANKAIHRAIEDGTVEAKIIANSLQRIYEVSEAEDGISTEKYNQIKTLQTHLKGKGIYHVGDSITLNQQNNFLSVTEEQANRLLELERKALAPAIIETTAESAVDEGADGDSGPDQGRPALVAAKCDSHV